jgi:predicted kinase
LWMAEELSSQRGEAGVKTLIVFSGPCGAGKSTLARMEYASRRNTVLLSRDGLRRRYPGYTDSDLSKALIQRAARILNAGRNCIIDACNLHEHDRIRWETVAIICGAALEWRTVCTEMEVCIARDAAREDPVGDERIREQFALCSR